VIGNLLSIKRVSTDSTAYGWIDADGRFLVENDTELYRGVITFIPRDDTYDVGVKGRYARKLDAQPDQAVTARTSHAFTSLSSDAGIRPVSPDVSSWTQLNMAPDIHILSDLLRLWMTLQTSESTDVEFEIELRKEILKEWDSYNGIEVNWWMGERLQEIIEQTYGMSMPSGSFGGSASGQFSTMSAPMTTSGFPFPLPLPSKDAPFQPVPADTDWAIRAESVFFNHEDGVSRSVSGPFVDSHLLTTDTATSTSSAAIVAPGSSTSAWLTERRHTSIRLKRRRPTPRH